jgi:hypothetical protein
MKRLLAPAMLALLMIGLNWRLLFSTEFTWLELPGIYEHTLPLMQFQAGEIHKYRLPLWDPYTNAGRPLLGWNLPSALYPPHLLMLALPLKNGWLRQVPLHWYFALLQCAMALAMYSFARRGLALSKSASVFAGVVYALSVSSNEPHVLHACVWAPLVFQYARGSTAKFAFCLGMCWLPGSLIVPLSVTLAAVILKVHRGLVGVLLGLAVGGVAILPGLQVGTGSLVWSFPYFGAITCGLAVLGFAASWKDRERRWLLIALAAAGPGVPLALAAGAAYGTAAIRDRWSPRVAMALTAVGAALVFGSLVAWNVRHPAFLDGGPVLLSGFLALVLALLLWRGQPRNAATTALLLFLIEAAQWHRLPSRFDEKRPRQLAVLARDADVAGYLLRGQGDMPRTVIDPAVIPYDFGPWYGVETYAGPDPDAHSVAFWVSRSPAHGFDRLLYAGANGTKVYGTDRTPLPRPRVVPDDAGCADLKADFAARRADRMTIEVESTCAGRLESGGSRSAGWRPPMPWRVTAGKQRLEFRFWPVSLTAGAALTIFGLICCLGLAWRPKNKL